MTEPENTAGPVSGRRWRDPSTRQTFFLGLTAVWSIAVLTAVGLAGVWHFAEVLSACGRTIGGRAAGTTADITVDGARVSVACSGPSGTTEVPMNAPAAALLLAALGVVLAIAFLITYRVIRKRTR